MTNRYLPFNRPSLAGREFEYMQRAVDNAHLSGDGPFTRQCQAWLQERVGCRHALLTHSCTGALEMAALLAAVEAGDEILMPSFTFVSTANAFVLRGARPVFVDIRPDTLNIDEAALEEAITPRTRAIVAVHYAGVPCEMDPHCRSRSETPPAGCRGCRASPWFAVSRTPSGQPRRCGRCQLSRDQERDCR